MNVQEYISSGIVESYVLGLASPEEQQEFESMCDAHPEVLQARIDFEIALENQAMQNAVAPPAMLKQTIMNAVTTNTGSAKVIPMQGSPAVRSNWFKYAAAAAVILLAGSIFWNVSLYNQNKKTNSQLAQVKNDYDTALAKLSGIQKDINLLTGAHDGAMKMAAMKGMEAAPTASATVYWDSTSKNVYLMVNNLPKPASDKQYQLWALLNGQPIDLGLIPNEFFIGEKSLLLNMKNTSGAQAFAITLEKKGGSSKAGPEGTMYTLGNL